ncbi:MAG: macro domain-containing protein [Bacteroidetes bacterium]|nr:macro domain-containing protein [Bacteroidota bacterium]
MIFRDGDKSIEVIQGDITDYDSEAIVNAANNHFWMGGGVAGAIKRKGGVIIEEEAMKLGPRTVGEAILTSGGALSAGYVIHAAVMGQDLQTDSDKIQKATASSLSVADAKGIKSLAFPALGTGVGGFPLQTAAEIMITEVHKFLRTAKSLRRVTFVLYDDEALRIFAGELERIQK